MDAANMTLSCGSNETNCNGTGANFTWPDEADLWSEPQYYSYRYRAVGTFFQGIVLVIGVLGNVMVVVVVRRTQSMHSPTNCYLVSLAVADCVVLISSVPNEILSYYLIGNRWVWGDLGCALFIFCQNLGINASSLSLVAFTVERYVAICHPMRAHAVCTVNRAKRITTGVWMFALVYCSPWLGLTETKPLLYHGQPAARFCDFKRPRKEYLAYFFADLIVFYVVPLLVSCILYCLIARVLFARRVLSGAVAAGGPAGRRKTKLNNSVSVVVDNSMASSARAQVVKMLIVVVVVFAALWLPYRGMLVYNSFAMMFEKERFMDLWFLMFAKTCVFINSAINPILYNALSSKFRRAFQRTLTCRKSRGECGLTMSTYTPTNARHRATTVSGF